MADEFNLYVTLVPVHALIHSVMLFSAIDGITPRRGSVQ